MALSTETSASECLAALRDLVPDTQVTPEDFSRLVSIAGPRNLTSGPVTLSFAGANGHYLASATHTVCPAGLRDSVTCKAELRLQEPPTPIDRRAGVEPVEATVAEAMDLVRSALQKLVSAVRGETSADMGSLNYADEQFLPTLEGPRVSGCSGVSASYGRPSAARGARRPSAQLPLFAR